MNDTPTQKQAQASGAPVSSSGPTAAGNQNLIVGLILGAAVLLVFLLVLQMTGSISGEKTEIAKIREEIEIRKKELTTNQSPVFTLGETADDLAARLSTDAAKLAASTTQLQAMLGTAQANLKDSQDTVRNLSSQLAAASNSIVENSTLRQQLTAALGRATTAEKQLQSLQQQPGDSASAAQLESLRQERDTLRIRLAQLEASAAEMEPRSVANDLRIQLSTANQDLAALQAENGKLRTELGQPRSEVEKKQE